MTPLRLSSLFLAGLLVAACSSSSGGTSTTASGTSPGGGSGAAIAADKVGGACSGVGTSPGDSAVFKHDDCPAGLCVADARTDFDTYCTADCENATCPDGYSCEAVTFGEAKHACLKKAGK